MIRLFILLFLIYANQLYADVKIDYSGAYNVTSVAATEKYAIFGHFDGNIRLVNPETSDIILINNLHKKEIVSIKTSANGKYMASAGLDDVIILYDIENLKEVQRITKKGMGVRDIFLNKNGDKLYIAYPSSIYEYETKNFINTGIYENFQSSIYSIALNNEENIMAVGGKNGDIYILDLEKGEVTSTYKAGNNVIVSIDFAEDKDLFISGSYDNMARLHKLGDMKPINEFPFFKDAIKSVNINKDGSKVAIGSSDGLSIIYDLSNNKIINKTISDTGEVTAQALPKSFKFIAYGKGIAYEEERFGAILYYNKKDIYRKLYSMKDCDIIISESGYFNGIGNFASYLSSYYKGKKETIIDIMEKYLQKDKLKVTGY